MTTFVVFGDCLLNLNEFVAYGNVARHDRNIVGNLVRANLLSDVDAIQVQYAGDEFHFCVVEESKLFGVRKVDL
ncbi:MAG: hypothetical protein MZU97_04225 [Bacillus subtilis]|nr:hypothetical protein [Bacillus subtilis]